MPPPADGIGVRALAFDVFGTVVDWRGSVIGELKAFGRRHAVDADWAAFVDRWKRYYRPGMDAVNAGRFPFTRVADIYRPGLDALLGEFGIRGIGEEEIRDLNRAWQRCAPWPDAVPGLERLKPRYVLATLSNADMAGMIAMAKRGGLPWDCVLCAELFRRYKPAHEVYLGALEFLDLKPAQVMMVAAHNYDLNAARSHGMRTAFVARPAEHGPGQTSDLEPEEDWDVAVTDFGALAAALGA